MDEVFTRTDSAGARNFLADALGGTLALSDWTGTLQTQYTYEPFGNTVASGFGSANPYQYTGRENDGTGLYFYRARYYNPVLQRFITEDPAGFAGGINTYAYARGNPVSYADPFGLWTGSVGVSVSWTFPWGFTSSGAAGFAFDGQGHFGSYWGTGVGVGAGAKASGGISLAGSNGQSICDLRGPFGNVSLGGGEGAAGTADYFQGSTGDGRTVAGTGVTLGVGAGASASATVTKTFVHPFGRYSCN